MYRFKLYNSDEVEALQKEITIYRNTLETMNIADLIEKYIQAKSEVYSLKYDFLKQEGDISTMKEFLQNAIEKYENVENELSSQIQEMNNSLSQLMDDVNWIKNRVKHIDFDKLDITEQQEKKEKTEIDMLKEEIGRLKELILENHKKEPTIDNPEPPKQSEYRRLQEMLQSSNFTEPANQVNMNLPPTQNYRRPISNLAKETSSFTQHSFRSERQKNSAHFDLINKTIVRSKRTAKTPEIKNTDNATQNPPFQTNKTETSNHDKDDSNENHHKSNNSIEAEFKTDNINEHESIQNDVQSEQTPSNKELDQQPKVENNENKHEQLPVETSNHKDLDNLSKREKNDKQDNLLEVEEMNDSSSANIETSNEINNKQLLLTRESTSDSTTTETETISKQLLLTREPTSDSTSTDSNINNGIKNKQLLLARDSTSDTVSTNIKTMESSTDEVSTDSYKEDSNNENQFKKTFLSLFSMRK